MKIRQLENAQYAGRRFTARYQTNGYYEITAAEGGFRIAYTPFEAPAARSFDDVMFDEWLEAPVAFGAFERDVLLRLCGRLHGKLEQPLSDQHLCVFDKAARGQGIGSMLMARITEAARARGARMLVLETQSCNEAAIAFYRKNGFRSLASTCMPIPMPTPSGARCGSRWARSCKTQYRRRNSETDERANRRRRDPADPLLPE